MSAKTEKVPQAAPEMPPPSVSFYFDKRLKAPAKFLSLSLGEKVVVQVSGKVIRLSSSQRMEGESEATLEIQMDRVEIVKGGIQTMKEAHGAAMSKAAGLMEGK